MAFHSFTNILIKFFLLFFCVSTGATSNFGFVLCICVSLGIRFRTEMKLDLNKCFCFLIDA